MSRANWKMAMEIVDRNPLYDINGDLNHSYVKLPEGRVWNGMKVPAKRKATLSMQRQAVQLKFEQRTSRMVYHR